MRNITPVCHDNSNILMMEDKKRREEETNTTHEQYDSERTSTEREDVCDLVQGNAGQQHGIHVLNCDTLIIGAV